MEKIVVADLFRLGKDGDKFSKEFKTKVRSKAKVSEDYVAQINANWKVGGQLFVIDKDATKERDEKVSESKDPLSKMGRDELKEKADELGIDYPKNIKTSKLIELIKEN